MGRPSDLNMNSESNPWDDLVVSILAVNRFDLERAYGLLKQLRTQRLTDPEELSRRTLSELYSKLVTAGYNRGEFMTYLFAERLSSLGAFAKQRGIAECEKVMTSNNVGALEELLLSVKGIGPIVVKNYRTLRQA